MMQLRRWVSCMRTTDESALTWLKDADISKRYHFTRRTAELRALHMEFLIFREGQSTFLTTKVRQRVATDY